MRLPALIIASEGSGYRILYRSKAFDSLNPVDLDAVCRRMNGCRFEEDCAYFITQSLGKMVIGRSAMLTLPESGGRKVKVTHCYFMNMSPFMEIVRGYRRQGAVISTFIRSLEKRPDESVENVTFVKRSMAESVIGRNDIVDTVISLGMTDANKKFMLKDIRPEYAMRVLFEYFPASFISDLSILTSGEPGTNDMNILFGGMNVLSDNRVLSIHTAAKGISNLAAGIESFVMSSKRDFIIEIMEHADRLEKGYLAELLSVTGIITTFEKSGVISASKVIKLMDKASTIEGKMSIYGLVIEMRDESSEYMISDMETLERYWAFVFYTSVTGGDKKNAALVHNVCARQRGVSRERYLEYIKEAVELKYDETDDEDLALLVLLAHEKTADKTRLINQRYDTRMARSFLSGRLSLGPRLKRVEEILMEMNRG